MQSSFDNSQLWKNVLDAAQSLYPEADFFSVKDFNVRKAKPISDMSAVIDSLEIA
jgi:hypothetical protein